MEVKLDLHIHSAHSPDGRMSLDEIVSCARARGLQGVAVCDHDRALTETWDAPDFLLIPGIELSTDQGHLLGLFVTEQIDARELGAAIDAVHACGGLAVMAHPFERSSDSQRLDAYLDRLDGIEVWNGRADRKNPQANAMAAVIQPLSPASALGTVSFSPASSPLARRTYHWLDSSLGEKTASGRLGCQGR